MTRIDERVSTHVYKVKRISKEEMESIAGVCVYDQPPFCNAACPLKLDVKAMLKAAAENDFKKAFKIYESIAPFPLILSAGCGAKITTVTMKIRLYTAAVRPARKSAGSASSAMA